METIVLADLKLGEFGEFVPYQLIFESLTDIDTPDGSPEMFVVMSQWLKLGDDDQSNKLLALFDLIEGDFLPSTELYYETSSMVVIKTELYNRT